MTPSRRLILALLLTLILPAMPLQARPVAPPETPWATAPPDPPPAPPASPESARARAVPEQPQGPPPAPAPSAAAPTAGSRAPSFSSGPHRVLAAAPPERPPAPPAPPESPRPPSPPARAPEPAREETRTQLFQIAMVVASTNDNSDLDGDGRPDPPSASSLESLPRGVRRALADLGGFLPYKRYLLLDTALLRTAWHAAASMKGPGGREFRAEIRLRPQRDEGDPELMIQDFEVIDMTRHPLTSVEVGGPEGFKHRSETPPPPGPTQIISTSFGMSVGETLVVGTSRLNGSGTALIFLVTAAP